MSLYRQPADIIIGERTLAQILDLHAQWRRTRFDASPQGECADLGGAYLGGADLGGANLGGANLGGANLRGAYLRGAYLRGANLRGADLGGADLRGAYLRGADLGGADLRGAYLGGAYLRATDLRGAYLSDSTVLDTGETFALYLSDVLPSLLTAGGKTVEAIVASGAWECHSWSNCPMAEAFGADSLNGVPALLRPRAEQFIALFDAGLLPVPTTAPLDTEEAAQS